MIDSLQRLWQSACVQSVELCRKNTNALETRGQLPLGRLNTRLTHVLCGSSPAGIVSTLANRLGGDFQPLNRETASRHTVRRNMVGLPSGSARGRAREDRQTHRPTAKENVSSLAGVVLVNALPDDQMTAGFRRVVKSRRLVTTRVATIQHHSGNCGFLFLSLFRGDNSHMRRPWLPHLFLGESFVFSSLLCSFSQVFLREL